MPAIPINEKPDYNTDQIANAISSNDMWDCITEVVPGVGSVTRRRPALKPFADLGTGAQGDGLFWWDDKGVPVAVSGGRIFTLNLDGTFTEITGSTLAAGAPVTFAAGTDHAQIPWLYMANGKLAYSVNGAATVAPTDPDTPAASHVDWIDEKFIANNVGTNQFLFTDVNDDVTQKVISIKVDAGTELTVATTAISNLLFGKEWVQQLNATGGTGALTWSGTFPGGTAVPGSGYLDILTPPAVGTYPFTVTVTDSAATPVSISKTFTVTVVASPPAVQLPTAQAITWTAGVYQEYQFEATGGTGPIVFSGSYLPAGLSLSAAGLLSGTIAAVGISSILITAFPQYPNEGASCTVTLTAIAQPSVPGTSVVITTATLPDAQVGVPYNQTLAATGGVGTLNWSGALPSGLTISPDGVISGVPAGPAGATAVTISVNDGSKAGFFDNTFWSGANNPVIANAKGQKVAALMVAWQQVYAWGSLGCQIFQDDGSTPFVNIPGAFIEAGLEAPYSIKRGNNAIFALCVIDGKRVVVLLIGSTPRVVSEPIARVLAEMPTVSDAIGGLISVGGLAIYLLQFPTSGQSWAYDYKNDEWFRWGSWNVASGDHDNFLGQHSCFCKAWNKHLIMSRVDGKIYELDRNTFADAGAPMVSYRRTGWIDHGMIFNRKRSNQLYIKVKVFAQDGTTNPVLMFRWRDDGNPNWSSYLELPLNPNFQGDCLIKLNRMGMYRMRQYEFRLSDNVDLALVAATEEVTEMRN